MLTPSRLKLARHRRGLTREQLSQVAGITTRSLLAYENGTQRPSPDNLDRLADALDMPTAFLQGGDVDEIPVEAISFRALSKITAGKRDMARSAGRIALMLAQWIDQRRALPTPDVPNLVGADPEKAAETLRNRWELPAGGIDCMINLLEGRGVRVFCVAMDCHEVDAYSFVWNATPFVFLNTTKTAERTRFDAAHELGHLVLHAGSRPARGPQTEREADRFAGALLMPRASILASGLRNASAQHIIASRNRWQVSAMALAHRLHELSLLTDWGYRAVCIDLARLGYRSGEPGGIAPEHSQVVVDALQTTRPDTSLVAQAAHDLHLTVGELEKYIRGLLPEGSSATHRRTPPRRPTLTLLP
ncbi:helix-turn-helix domain-containing protein [Micromonospora sp. NBC_01813]|uniref:helix-turn-helix domain-containing protein n=1 Tax=Micromonospora sp. NBC_01813 TaxID=2975988 RepID=UPI002DD8354E|nr:XRE family transcriptional regulator [Micromonospora sp. NBC_01813]WSA06948.1 XRE family transcriptional regulator [Micromonospora sp. NBC_01813]